MPKLSLGANRIYGEAAFEVLARAQEMEKMGKKVLHFEIGEPDMETPEHIATGGHPCNSGEKNSLCPIHRNNRTAQGCG